MAKKKSKPVKRIESIEDLMRISGTAAAELKKPKKTKSSKSVKLPKTSAEQEKDRIKRKKKKAKKHDPSSDEKTERVHKFFNDMPKIISRDLIRELNKIADKYDVDHINLKSSAPYPDDFFARDWSWRASFFIKDFEQYENSVSYTFVDHYRYWLDSLIGKCSCMVWNLVLKTIKAEHKKTGVVPKSPLSKKKGRDSIEAVAEYYANKESEEFEEKFK